MICQCGTRVNQYVYLELVDMQPVQYNDERYAYKQHSPHH